MRLKDFRLFTSTAVLLAGILSVLAWASIVLGRAQPISDVVQKLHLSDCALPCWGDVTPGVTSADEARERISALFPELTSFPMESDANLIWIEDDESEILNPRLMTILNEGLVTSVNIYYPADDMPSLGELAAVFGAPSCVLIDKIIGYTYMIYENPARQVMLHFSANEIGLFSPAAYVSFGASERTRCDRFRTFSWRGLRYWESS